MKKKERWLRCIDNQPIDRPPMTFWHHYTDATPQAHIKTYRETGIDMVKMMSDGYNDITFGVTVKTPSDWKHIKIPDLRHPFVTGQLERIQRVVEVLGDECAIYYVVFSAFTLMRMSWNREMCFAHIKDPGSRPYILEAVEHIGDFLAEMSAHLIREGGLTGLLPCFNTNGHTQFTAEQYAAWQGPQDRKLLAAINQVSSHNIAHFCGYNGIKNNLSAWYDYTAAVAHWDIHTEQIPLREGRKSYPNVRAIMGGLTISRARCCTREARRRCRPRRWPMWRRGGAAAMWYRQTAPSSRMYPMSASAGWEKRWIPSLCRCRKPADRAAMKALRRRLCPPTAFSLGKRCSAKAKKEPCMAVDPIRSHVRFSSFRESASQASPPQWQ